jgi:hypothetical protein
MDFTLIAIYLFNIFDLFTTRIFINLGLAEEANPLMNMLLDTYYMELYKILIYPVLLLILKAIYDYSSEYRRKALIASFSLFSIYLALFCYEIYGYYVFFI